MTEKVVILAVTLSVGIPLIALSIGAYFVIKHIEKQIARDQARDVELADRGYCVYCGHTGDHRQCHENKTVKPHMEQNRCTYCLQRIDHSQCAAIYGSTNAECSVPAVIIC
jgi:hypothetical protein